MKSTEFTGYWKGTDKGTPGKKMVGANEAVGVDRSKQAGYPNDPATQKHRLDTAKALLSDPKTDPDSRREAAAIVARYEKQGVAEGEIERQHGDLKPWAYWNSPERVAQKLYKIHGGAPIDKAAIVALWKQDGPDRMTKLMLKPDVAAILSNYEVMSDHGPMFNEGDESDSELFGEGPRQRLTKKIGELWDNIYEYGDRGLDYLDGHDLLFNRMWEKYSDVDGDVIEAICRDATDIQLKKIASELENVVSNMQDDIEMDDEEDDMFEADAELAEPPAPERKQQTKTKDKPRLDPNVFGPKADQPLAKTDPLDDLKKNAGMGGDKPEVNIRKASQQSTLDKTAGLGTPEMGDMLSRLRGIEVNPDLEPYQQDEPEDLPSVEVNTANLPAVAGEALAAAGVQNPEFHQVANLPGNMADMIRQLGKSLFGALTMTPTKRIHVVANLGGKGPNTTQEVQAVANFLQKNGDDRGPGDIDFEQVMPGYKAQTHMYTAAGIRWMLVKDFAGQYIYCWPEEDSHDAATGIEHDADNTKQLR